VKQAGFVVLWKTTMPSVLIETGFLSHSTEEQFLSGEKGQDLIASGIYRAFKEYKSEVESIN
jgi:N-acetylmuramoyl-L-alanine amidase